MAGPSQTREEILQEGYERFNAGEVERLLEVLDPQIVWEDAPEVPGSRTYRGHREVRRFLLSFARLWEPIRFEPAVLRAHDETVVAFCRMEGRGRSSGANVSQRVGHVWDFRDLRVVRVRTFLDWARAAKAGGVTAPGR